MKNLTIKSPFRHPSVTLLSLALILIIAGVFILPASTSSQTSFISIPSDASDAVAIQAAGRGNPQISLKDGRDLLTVYSARSSLRQALIPGLAQPLALASDDFDGDGLKDLVVAYSSSAGGVVSIHRSNISAFVAENDQQLRNLMEGGDVPAFHATSRAIELPETPHFLGTGDFNRDGYKDIVSASRGGIALWVLEGDGRGEFTQASRYEMPGQIDVMMTGDLMRRDGAADVALAISGPQGAELLVYEGQGSIFMREPVRAALPAAATSIAAGDLDGDRTVDLALAAGNDLVIARGYDQLAGSGDAQVQVERTGFPFLLQSIVVGEFIWDREGKPEVAMLSDAGMVHIATRGELDRRGFSQDEVIEWAREQGKHRSPYTQSQLQMLRERLDELGYPKTAAGNIPSRQQAEQWTVAESHQMARQTSEATSLIVANLSGGSPLDLMVVDPTGRQLHLLMGEREVFARPDQADNSVKAAVRRERPPAVSFDVDGEPVAAMALKLNFDTRPDLVVLRKDHLTAVITPSAPLATFTVDRTDDNAGAMACTAAANDCSLRGAFRAANANAGPDSIVVPAGTYTLTLGPADDDALVLSNESAGDLDIRGIFDGGSADNDITLTGAGAATTIIQASATAGSGIDRLVDVDPVFGGSALNFNVSGVTLRNGRAQAPNSAGGDGGAIRFLGAQLPHSPASIEGTLTIANSTVSNNQSTNPTAGAPGGAINVVFGKVVITGSTFSGNNAGNGAGGAILFDGGLEGDSQLTVSSTTFSNNTTLNATNGNGGGLFSTGGRAVTISNANFSSNQAAVDGGGYRISIAQAGFSVTIIGGTYSGNMAGRHGGGIYSDPQDTGASTPVTISNATFSGNIADNDANNTGDGGGIFHNRGMLNLTNTSMSGTANTAVNGGGLAHRFVSGVTPSNTSTIVINGGTFSGNSAMAEGGAIFQDSTSEAGTGSVINIGVSTAVTFQNNTARTNGGAIANLNSGDVNITGGAISGNTADSDNNNTGDGGGIYNSNATVVLSGSATIGQNGSPNIAVNGGGMRHVSGTLTMTGGSVSFNSAKGNGGGVSAATTVTFNSGVSFTNNVANLNGGGIHITGGTASINGGGVIQGNTADNDNNNTGDGGGIFNSGGTVLLPNSTTIGGAGALRNRAQNGGGINNASGTVTITGGSITGNQATVNGGGVGLAGGTVSLSGVAVNSNTASGNGGGISRDGGTLNLTNVTIGASGQSNSASNGGGIANSNGTLTINAGNATITNNTATMSGGGVFTSGGIVNLNDLSLSANSAANGGAAAASGGTTNITRCQIINNAATTSGGGIFNNGGAFAVSLSRFFGNTAASGTGVNNMAGTVTAENNWWGCDDFPASGTAGCQTAVGTVDADPRIDLRLLPNPTAVSPGGTSTLTADVTQNTDGAALPGGAPAVLEGLTATFATDSLGAITPPLTQTIAGGMATRTWTAGPTSGDSTVSVTLDNGAQTAVIVIQEPPQITCPSDITVNTDPGLCTASVAFNTTATGNPSPTITCMIGMTVITSPHNFPVGASTVTCTASNGVPPDATCSFMVTVIDNEPPAPITCPADIKVTEDPQGSGTAVVNYMTPTSTDNCSVTVTCMPASGAAFPIGTTTVTCTAADPSGNTQTCTFMVSVNPACQITCPNDITVNNDPGQCGAMVNYPAPSTTGNCGTVTCNPPAGSFFPVGTTAVTCTTQSGPSCSFNVTVNDTEAPMIACPANITVGNDPDACSAVVSYNVKAADNCPGVSAPMCSPASGSVFPLGATNVSCSVIDAAGNTANCSFTVTVNDTQPPAVMCPANITVPAAPGMCSAVVTFSFSATDNCPGVQVVANPPSGTAFSGTTTVTVTATDAAGNTSICTFTVTVLDTQPPMITCPPNQTAVTASPGDTQVVVTYPPPTVTDSCPGTTVVCNPPSGSMFPAGTTTVVCTATDPSGNTDMCSFTVSVFDVCLQDDSNPSIVMMFNSSTGEYRFCCGGAVFVGVGKVTRHGNVFILQHTSPGDRRVVGRVDASLNIGNATLQIPAGTTICTITDRDTTDNTCSCM